MTRPSVRSNKKNVTMTMIVLASLVASPAFAATKTTKKAAKAVTTKKAATTKKGATVATSAPASAAPTTAAAAAAPSDVVNGKKVDLNAVLRAASTTGARTMDPIKVTTCAGEWPTIDLVYARLTDLTPDFKVTPYLADSWEFSKDGTNLTLHLHKGVKFRDGTAFNSSAVKANLDRVITDPKSTIKAELASIASVATVDDSTVQINLKPKAGFELPMKLSGCAGMIVNPASFAKADLDQIGDGLGAYVVKPGSFRAGQFVAMVRQGDWWGPAELAPHFSEVDFQPILDGNTQLNLIQSGQVDVINTTPETFDRSEKLAKSGDVYFHKFETLLNVGIALNLNRPILATQLRQAINVGIDRKAVAATAFFGGCTPSVQPAFEGGIGYDPKLEETWAYNPTLAKELYTKSGVSNPTIIDIQHTTTPYNAANDVVSAQLKAIGINFSLTQPASSTVVIPQYRNGEGDAFGFPLGASLNPLGTTYDFAYGVYVSPPNGRTTDAVKAAGEGILDPLLSDDARAVKALALNRAIVNDATMLTLCRIQKGVVGTTRLVSGDQTIYVKFGTFDVGRMYLAAK